MEGFLRIYSGELTSKSRIYNANKNFKENCEKLFIPFANQMKPVKNVKCGNIVVVSGLKKTTTGDTLLESEKIYENAVKKLNKNSNTNLLLPFIQIPPPVYFCTIEVASQTEINRLTYALKCLQREDPSLEVVTDDEENLGQIVIQGMGELHLDIIKERILKEYGLKVYYGPLQIAYKEKPTIKIKKKFLFEKIINLKKNQVDIELTLVPTNGHIFETVKLIRSEEQPLHDITTEQLNAIDHGIKSALNSGILLRYPVIDVDVHLTAFNASKNTILPLVSTATHHCISDALKSAECIIMQPIMKIEITTQSDYSSKVIHELSKRHSKNVTTIVNNLTTLISSETPLAQLSSFSNDLRRLTSGHTTFSIEFKSYEQITQKEYQNLLQKI